MKYWVVFVLLGMVAADYSGAQVNIERIRGSGARGFSGAAKLDLSTRSGNEDVHRVGLNGVGRYGGQRFSELLAIKQQVGWANGRRFSNQGLVHLRLVHHTKKRLQIEGFTQSDYNRSRKLDFRALLGGGLRALLLESKSVEFWWGSGYMFEHERLELDAGDRHAAETSVHRWSNYISAQASISQRVEFTWSGYLQPQIGAWGDVRVLSESQLSADLGGPFSLEISYNLRFDSKPPLDVAELDSALNSGLSVRF